MFIRLSGVCRANPHHFKVFIAFSRDNAFNLGRLGLNLLHRKLQISITIHIGSLPLSCKGWRACRGLIRIPILLCLARMI